MCYHDGVRCPDMLHRLRRPTLIGLATALAFALGCGPAGNTGPDLAAPVVGEGPGTTGNDPAELPPIGEGDPQAEQCLAGVRGQLGSGSTTLGDCRLGGLGACETRCRQGELRSCRDLARAMAAELGDDGCATKIWELTCDRGEPTACMDLAAHLSARGTGAGDRDRAKRALERSCDVGWGAGCTALGRFLLVNAAGPSDRGLALKMLEKACDRDHAPGCALAAQRLSQSRRQPDQVRSVARYRRACKLGHDRSCVSLATALQSGSGVRADPVKAKELLEEVCDRDDANDQGLACMSLASRERARAQGARTRLRDELEARACTKGHLDACPHVVAAYYHAGRFVEAVALATPLTAKRPEDGRLRFALGMSLYNLGRFVEAETHLAELCRLDPKSIRAQLWLYAARMRAGHDGKAGLRQALPNLDRSRWPAPVAQFFLGRIGEAGLLAKARDPHHQIELERRCEAYFYIAQQHLIAGRKRQAEARLEQALDTGATSLVEYRSAKAQRAELSTIPR